MKQPEIKLDLEEILMLHNRFVFLSVIDVDKNKSTTYLADPSDCKDEIKMTVFCTRLYKLDR